MSDGAHIGVNAERALATVLGGAPPPEETGEETMSADEMTSWLFGAEPDRATESYSEAARYAGRLILEAFLATPELVDEPSEAVYDWDADPDHGTEGMKPEFTRSLGLYETLKAQGVPLGLLGLSGFQWGWAVNAARRCVQRGPVANPAIIEIVSSE